MVNPGHFREQMKAAKKLRVAPHIERYLKTMEGANPEKRIKLLQEIAKLLKPEVAHVFVTELARYLDDKSEPVRHATIDVLEKAQKLDPLVLVPVLGPVANRLNDKDPHLRQQTLRMVCDTGKAAILEVIPFIPSLVALLKDPDPQVAKEAVESLSHIGVSSPNAMLRHLTRLLDPKQPQACLNSLATLSGMAHLKPESLKRAIPGLLKLVGEKEGAAGEAVRELLANLGRTKPGLVVPPLMELLKDTDTEPPTQWGALRVATFIAEKHPKMFTPLLDQIARDLQSNEWELREQAAMLLGNVGRRSLGRVKDAIPALVETLSDADELVRSAAQKAIELINISSVDYTRIEKATKALKSAEFVIKSSRNFGANVAKSEALLQDAHKAFTRARYQDAYDYAQRAEKLAHRQEKVITDTRNLIRSCSDKVRSVARAGIDVKEPERMLGVAEKLLKRREFKAARTKAQRAVKLAQEVKLRARPDLTLKGLLEKPPKEDTWSPLALKLRNLGAAAARDVTLQFSDTFAVRGPSIVESLGPGQSITLKLSCYPKSKGLVPFSVDMTYHSFEGTYYSNHLKDILEVGLEQADFSPRELFVSPIQATIVPAAKPKGPGPKTIPLEELPTTPSTGAPTTTSGPPTRFSPVGDYYVICDNCSARIPSNFRLCGRCGHRLPTHEERKVHNCPACQAQIQGDYKFCGRCGTSLATNCPQCQSPVVEGFRFCGRCGTRVT